MCVATPFLVTVRKTRKEVGKENRKKNIIKLSSLLAEVQPFNVSLFSAFTPEIKKTSTIDALFEKKNVKKPDIGLEGKKNHKHWYRYRVLANKKGFDKKEAIVFRHEISA
ncbi:hypothetical protein CEXT_647771 [Caerostris extrusa]|uniref:Uncharacterized protein n=1 Tax=Caerostris extrusa TaxID=172846 RepID=A0AAV4RZ50_CAEEX|nr:hypothetical protein CEXT_647771 [Caerostris extrusa]